VPAPAHPRGNFLAFDLDEAERVHERLLQEGIYVDRRDRRLRFGFGVYHEAGSVDRLLEALEAALR
jgi:selenocysteine lyase/cysteine desulfurase